MLYGDLLSVAIDDTQQRKERVEQVDARTRLLNVTERRERRHCGLGAEQVLCLHKI